MPGYSISLTLIKIHLVSQMTLDLNRGEIAQTLNKTENILLTPFKLLIRGV